MGAGLIELGAATKTAAEITARMQRVKIKDITAWQQRNLPSTIVSRYQLLYHGPNPKHTKPRNANRR